MKDLEHAERYHIRAIQCKARTQFDAFIDISKYVGHQFAMLRMASEVKRYCSRLGLERLLLQTSRIGW